MGFGTWAEHNSGVCTLARRMQGLLVAPGSICPAALVKELLKQLKAGSSWEDAAHAFSNDIREGALIETARIHHVSKDSLGPLPEYQLNSALTATGPPRRFTVAALFRYTIPRGSFS